MWIACWRGVEPCTERILAQAAQRSRSPKQRAQIHKLRGYLQANWAGIQDYREALGSVPLDARGLGAIESNIDKVFANRFKKRGMSWGRRGAGHLSQLVVLRINGTLTAWLGERSKRPFSTALKSAVRTVQHRGRDIQQETGAWQLATTPSPLWATCRSTLGSRIRGAAADAYVLELNTKWGITYKNLTATQQLGALTGYWAVAIMGRAW
ncbi:MAG: UPF0236 family protein [Armatimonadota bacterium]|nr:UPF0236 family protein [Armatimonadota bacterium]